MNIVVVGSSNTDMIIKVPRIPKPGETILGGTFSIASGGKGANQAVAAARAGGKVTFIARVGQDMFGDQAIEGFKKDGIDVQYVTKDKKAPSGVALIFVAADGENTIAVASGANNRLSVRELRTAKTVIESAKIVVTQLETPLTTVQAAGKNLQISLAPEEIQPALEQISARGLFISTWARTESEARALLKNAERWSVDRG